MSYQWVSENSQFQEKKIYCSRFCLNNHQNYHTNWFILSEGHCAECFTYVNKFKPHKFKW